MTSSDWNLEPRPEAPSIMPKGKKARVQSVPYARGFRPPSAKKCLEACAGRTAASLGKEYALGENFFPPLPKPSSIDDWLAQYVETGQTYAQFLHECPWLSTRKAKYIRMTFNPNGKNLPEKYPQGKIYLQPLGEFDGKTTPNFADLVEYSQAFYSLPVEMLSPVSFSEEDGEVFWVEEPGMRDLSCNPLGTRKSKRTTRYRVESRFDAKSGRRQLQAGSILLKMKQSIPNDAICLIALTMSDLFDTKTDLFVAGLAAGNHRVGVFSFSRYDPTISFSTEFWYKFYTHRPSKPESDVERRKLILQRSCKLLVHELAHLLGVDHCIWYSCCMNGSGHLSEDFQQAVHLCPVDLRKLQALCGFDVQERYEKLLQFFTRCALKDEGEWVAKRLEFIRAYIVQC